MFQPELIVQVDTRSMQQWLDHLPEVLQAAPSVEAHATQADIERQAPVDTGALAHSGYVVSGDGSGDYGDRVSACQTLNPQFVALPELPQPRGYAALIAMAASYAVFQEYGSRFMGAQPFFWAAVARAEQRFPDTLKRMLGW